MIKAFGDLFRLFIGFTVAAGLFEMAHGFNAPETLSESQALFLLFLGVSLYVALTVAWRRLDDVDSNYQ